MTEIPKTRKKPYKAHPKFSEPQSPPTTTTPIAPQNERRVNRQEMVAVMHRQITSDFRFYGSRNSLRKVTSEPPEGVDRD